MIWLKGEKEGEIKGRRRGEIGLGEEGQEIKDQGTKEEEKAPAAPANRFLAIPSSRLCSELLSRMLPPWDARPEQKGSGALGRHTGQAAGDHWACLALQGDVPLLPAHPLTS